MKVISTCAAKGQLACCLLCLAHFLKANRTIFTFQHFSMSSLLVFIFFLLGCLFKGLLHFLSSQWQSPSCTTLEERFHRGAQFRGDERPLPNSIVVLGDSQYSKPNKKNVLAQASTLQEIRTIAAGMSPNVYSVNISSTTKHFEFCSGTCRMSL